MSLLHVDVEVCRLLVWLINELVVVLSLLLLGLYALYLLSVSLLVFELLFVGLNAPSSLHRGQSMLDFNFLILSCLLRNFIILD